jgi:hypothetical protein
LSGSCLIPVVIFLEAQNYAVLNDELEDKAMMKLSMMKKVVETVNAEWKSPLAEKILEKWGYDKGTVYYFRSSANFLFVFNEMENHFFLDSLMNVKKSFPK